MTVTIRRLSEADAQAWRALRLEGLERHPESFAAEHAMEAAQPLSYFADRIAQTRVWAAFAGAEMVGTAGLRVHPGAKMRHKGILVGMYVREGLRGTGAAEALVEALVADARGLVEVIHLSVVADNRRACRFYDRLGFAVYGLERRALKVGDRYYDEELRARFLIDPVSA